MQRCHALHVAEAFVVERAQCDVERLQLAKRRQCAALHARLAQHQFLQIHKAVDLLEPGIVEADAVQEVITESQLFQRADRCDETQVAAEVFVAIRITVPDRTGQAEFFQVTQRAQPFQIGRIDIHAHPVENFQFEISVG